jgi:hypothetical protein
MKPGRVKNEFGLIGSPIYSSFHVVEFELGKIRGLIQRCDAADSGARVFYSGFLRAQRHFNRTKPFLYPLETEPGFRWPPNPFPPWSSLPRLLLSGWLRAAVKRV